MTNTVRLLLVDENDDVLDGLCAWLREIPDFEVIGIAHSAREGIDRIRMQDPDVVLMDMSLPDLSGLEATRQIKSLARAPLVVLMSFHDSHAIRAEAKAAGADDFLSKPDLTGDILSVIQGALRSRAQAPIAKTVFENTARPSRPVGEVEE